MNRNRKRMNVFVIDEDKRLRQSLKYQITSFGHAATAFESVEQCMMSHRLKPDLVFLDQRSDQAKLNNSILREIKLTSPQTQIVILSNKKSLDLAVRALKNGASDFLVKDATLLARVGIVLDKVEQNLPEKPKVTQQLLKLAVPSMAAFAFTSLLFLLN